MWIAWIGVALAEFMSMRIFYPGGIENFERRGAMDELWSCRASGGGRG
jgi:hypothetical protein